MKYDFKLSMLYIAVVKEKMSVTAIKKVHFKSIQIYFRIMSSFWVFSKNIRKFTMLNTQTKDEIIAILLSNSFKINPKHML